jgi:hypothetical protein
VGLPVLRSTHVVAQEHLWRERYRHTTIYDDILLFIYN